MENEVTKKIEKVKCSAAGNLEVATGKLAEFCPLLVLCCIRVAVDKSRATSSISHSSKADSFHKMSKESRP